MLAALFTTTTTALAQRAATATPTVANGFVIAITITDGGSGYTDAPSVTVSGGNGSGASATATVLDGAVDQIIVGNAGSGYTGTPTVTIAAPPLPKPPFSDGLVAYYPMNGNAIDESGNENDLSPLNVAFGDTVGWVLNPAADFSKAGGHLIGEHSLFNRKTGWTWSGWLNPDSQSLAETWQAVFVEANYSSSDAIFYPVFLIGVDGRSVFVHSWNGDFNPPEWWISSSLPLRLRNGFQHVVLTLEDGGAGTGTLRAYHDGAFSGSTPHQSVFDNTGRPFFVTIGEEMRNPSSRYRGQLDSIRVYDRTLTADEVRDLYRYESPTPPTVSIKVETVQVTMHVTPSKRYQLVSSFDLKTWTNVGQPILAESSEIPLTLNALSVGQFFRVYEVQ